MSEELFKNKASHRSTHDFFRLEWSQFVEEVDALTGGNVVARQLFFDAREKFLKLGYHKTLDDPEI